MQALAVAHRMDAVSPQAVDAARTALATVRAREPAPVDPALLTEDVVVRRNGRPLECEQLLPRSEVVAGLGESYRLAGVMDLRPGFSMCDWKRASDLLVLSCPNCSREQAIGLARAAAR